MAERIVEKQIQKRQKQKQRQLMKKKRRLDAVKQAFIKSEIEH